MDGCPFCGGNPSIMEGQVGTSNLKDVWIECYQCGGRSPSYTTKEKTVSECIVEATTAWNKRYWR